MHFRSITYIHTVVQTSPPLISRTLSPLQTKTPYPWNNNCRFSPPSSLFIFKSLQHCTSFKHRTGVQSRLSTRYSGHLWASFEMIPDAARVTLASNQRTVNIVEETVTEVLITNHAKGDHSGSIDTTEHTGRRKHCVSPGIEICSYTTFPRSYKFVILKVLISHKLTRISLLLRIIGPWFPVKFVQQNR